MVDGGLSDATILQAQSQVLDGAISLTRAMTSTEVLSTSPLTLTIAASPDPVAPLATVTYLLTITNVGNSTLTNVVVQDTMPSNGIGLGASITGGGACPGNANCSAGAIVTWPTLTLTSGQIVTLSFQFQIAAGTANGTIIHDSATITHAGEVVSQGRDVAVHN
jgi:uncharacterized repeat protein (TIGR01451 family)